MSTRILGRPAPASNPAPEAAERLRQEALAEGEAELAGACAAGLTARGPIDCDGIRAVATLVADWIRADLGASRG